MIQMTVEQNMPDISLLCKTESNKKRLAFYIGSKFNN